MIKSKATLSTKSINLLKSIKGQTLTNIRTLSKDDHDDTYSGVFVLDFNDKTSIALSCSTTSVKYYNTKEFGDTEEVSTLLCKPLDKALTQHKLYNQKIKPFYVHDVEIITETMREHRSDDGIMTIIVDVAIILHSNNNFMTFSLDEEAYSSFWLNRTENKSINELRPIEKIERMWVDDNLKSEGVSNKITRSSRLL